MNAYSYLSILFSIVLGLALTNLLGAVARLMHNRARVKIYWPPLVWTLVIFTIIVQHWWAQYSLNRVGVWTFAGFLSVLVPPTLLYLLSELVLPQRYDDDDRVDLYTWYYSNRQWFFGLFAGVPSWAFVEDYILTGSLPKTLLEDGFLITFTLSALIGVFFRSPRIHEVFCVLTLVLFGSYTALLFAMLPNP